MPTSILGGYALDHKGIYGQRCISKVSEDMRCDEHIKLTGTAGSIKQSDRWSVVGARLFNWVWFRRTFHPNCEYGVSTNDSLWIGRSLCILERSVKRGQMWLKLRDQYPTLTH